MGFVPKARRRRVRDDILRHRSAREPIPRESARSLAEWYAEPYSPLARFADRGASSHELLAEIDSYIGRRDRQPREARPEPCAHPDELDALRDYVQWRMEESRDREYGSDGFER